MSTETQRILDTDCFSFASYKDFSSRVDNMLSQIDIGIKLPKTTRDENGKQLLTIIKSHRPLRDDEIQALKMKGYILPEHSSSNGSDNSSNIDLDVPPLSVISLDLIGIEEAYRSISLGVGTNPSRSDRKRIETQYLLRNVPRVDDSELHRLLRSYVWNIITKRLGEQGPSLSPNEIDLLRANLTPERMPNFIENCDREGTEHLLNRSNRLIVWRRSKFRGSIFYYREDSNTGQKHLAKAQDSYVMSYIIKDGKNSQIQHFLLEKVIGKGYYFSGGNYDIANQTFVFSKRVFYPVFLDIFAKLTARVTTDDLAITYCN